MRRFDKKKHIEKANQLNETRYLENKDLFKESDMGNNCECCQYFDFDTVEDSFSGLRHPVYYMIEKGESHELKYIQPKQYIYKIARGFGGLSYEDVVDSGAVNKDRVKQYAKEMESGDKFPIGYYRDGESGQEGRHRALALIELGCNEMPVVVIKKVSGDTAREFVSNHKNYSREQLDRLLKEMGYNGVSNLDWSNFRRYIDYRLK